jgi:phytoene synthase
MNDDAVRDRAHQILSRHARTFRWAAQFLPDDQRDDAAVVYAFCRLVDDTADESGGPEEGRRQLDRLSSELERSCPPRPLVGAYLEVAERRDMDLDYARELISGVRSDLGEVLVETDEQLLRYCYRVASTVGLMMCAVLGVEDPAATPHAIDLGVAMQLTNIARDVREDAEMGRVYLPAERLRARGVDQLDLVTGRADRRGVARVTAEIIEMAERYYESGEAGLYYIPLRSRLAILVAGRLYRGIGWRLRDEHDSDPLRGRTIVAWPRKFRLLGRALGDFTSPQILGLSSGSNHDRDLHHALRGLPGTRA